MRKSLIITSLPCLLSVFPLKKSLMIPKGNQKPSIEGQTTQWPKGQTMGFCAHCPFEFSDSNLNQWSDSSNPCIQRCPDIMFINGGKEYFCFCFWHVIASFIVLYFSAWLFLHEYFLNIYIYPDNIYAYFSVFWLLDPYSQCACDKCLSALTVIGPEVKTENRCRHLHCTYKYIPFVLIVLLSFLIRI
jgi:hypothetical protein